MANGYFSRNLFFLRSLLLLVLVVGAAITVGVYVFSYFNRANFEKKIANKEIFSVLIASVSEKTNALSLVSVLSFNAATERLAVLSLYPATKVKESSPTLDEVFRASGATALVSQISELVDEKIEGSLIFNEKVVERLVDLCGGVRFYLGDSDFLKGENLPKGEFILDGALVREYLNPPEKNEATPALRLFRYYSLALNLWQQRTDKWLNIKEETIFLKLIREVQSTISGSDLYFLAKHLLLSKNWIPIVAEVPVRRVKDTFIFDSESAALYLRNLRKQLTQKDNPFVVDPPKMEIKNGTAIPNVARNMRTDMAKRGIQILEFTNAERNDYEYSILLGTSGNAFYLENVARMLGITHAYAAVNRSLFTDLVLILGKDYKTLKGSEASK